MAAAGEGGGAATDGRVLDGGDISGEVVLIVGNLSAVVHPVSSYV